MARPLDHDCAPAPRRPRVLLVDDDRAVVDLVVLNLEHRGFSVAVARSSQEGAHELASAVPDAVLLDWELHDRSGLLLLHEWRATARCPAVPVLMLTGRAGPGDAVAAFAAGASDYIVKPCSMADLANRVRKAMFRMRRGPA